MVGRFNVNDLSTWELVLLGAMAVLVLFWFGPGIKGALAQSQQTEKDWVGFLLLMAAVVLFVLFLIMMV
jgi:amino acid transporter